MFETLESRRLYSLALIDNALYVDGTNGNDTIVIDRAGDAIVVSINDDAWQFAQSEIQSISVFALDGNDAVTIGSSLPGAFVEGGAGADTLVGGNGRDTLLGNAGKDLIRGNSGADRLSGGAGADQIIGGSGSDRITGGGGNDLLVGGLGNDRISAGGGNDVLRGDGNADSLYGEAGNDNLSGANGNDRCDGGEGNDTINSGAGSDRLYAGGGDDSIVGGDGNDTLVSIGGGDRDYVAGGKGADSIWADDAWTETIADASSDESAGGFVHRVTGFSDYFYDDGSYIPASEELNGQDLPDPIPMYDFEYWADLNEFPLFTGTGPTMNDPIQGSVGDCYFLAALSSLAKCNPELIRQSIVDLGDGTYAVRFFWSDTPTYLRVDGDVPATYGYLDYAALGPDGATWVALMEKAWAFFRFNEGTYESISGGWMSEVFDALGCTWTSIDYVPSTDWLVQYVQDALDTGKAVTLGTYWDLPGDSLLVSSHAYTIDSIITDEYGQQYLVLRNPWGIDGYYTADGTDDGYLAISAAEVWYSMSAIQIGNA